MKIAIITTYYSVGMGYTENCLPRALAKLGHEVHVITSNYNIYGNSPDYKENYEGFLGNAVQPCGTFEYEGYTVHRLPSRNLFGYIKINGLIKKVRALMPDIVHSVAIASVQTYQLSAAQLFSNYLIFAENHHHMSVVKKFLLYGFHPLKRIVYRLTRTLPTWLASLTVKRCYAVAPDCLEVAHRFYGVPLSKLTVQSLGTDTELFRPALSEDEHIKRNNLRFSLGFLDDDLICVYTGRFTVDKNPALLARAVSILSAGDKRWKAIFVGEGAQRAEIESCLNCKVVPFMRHAQLAELYRAVDIAVWPRQESMSMLDAVACGLPLIVADSIGESKRVNGNGVTYPENDLAGLVTALESLLPLEKRRQLGQTGREKMVAEFSWDAVARRYVTDFESALLK